MGIQTWIGKKSVEFPNLFMLKHVVEGGDALEENAVDNVQIESHVMDKFSIKRKRIKPTMSRNICWELAT